jgi:uncharacterized repeat protein (TIGR03806 family)
MFMRASASLLVVALLAGCSSGDDHGGGSAGAATSGGSGAGAAGGVGGGSGTGAAGAGAVAGGGSGGTVAGGGGSGGSVAGMGGVVSGGAGSGAGSGASGMAGSGAAGAQGCIVPATVADQPMLLSQTGCVDPTDPTKAAASLIAYEVSSPLWSDGAEKERYLYLPPGTKIHVKDCAVEPDTCMPIESGGTGEDEGHFDLPVGAVAMKVFKLGGKRIETRLLQHRAATTWQGYSYEWNDAETEATLLPDKLDKPIGDQTWHYPSQSECLECHTKGGGRSLGPTMAQMNRDHAYPDGTMNQIDKFVALGLFDATPTRIDPYPDPKDAAGDLTLRARSYLQANCSICHRPGGPISDVDLRFVTSFKDTALCNQPISMGTGDPMLPQTRLVPGDPSKSSISYRMHATVNYRMPKIGSSVVDPDGTKIIDDWITSLTDCPQ